MITRLNNRRKRNAGFTLIEMLVAVLIMGILLAVAIPLYLTSVKTASDNTAKNNLKSLATAGAAYRVKNQTFPTYAQLTLPGNSDIADPSDGNITYTSTTNTAAEEVLVATAPANTFSNGYTKWTYTASTGVISGS